MYQQNTSPERKMTLGERDAEKSDSQVLHGLIINNIITVNNTACHNNLTMTLRE